MREYRFNLEGNGSYDSDECRRFLALSDVVATNPPFSRIRSYLPCVLDACADVLVMVPQSCVADKELYPYVVSNRYHAGVTLASGGILFRMGDRDYDAPSIRWVDGEPYINLSGVRWFTSLEADVPRRKVKGVPFVAGRYDAFDWFKYPMVLNVDALKDIPDNWEGFIGVPITYFFQSDPDRWDIVDVMGRYAWGDYFGKNEDVRQAHSFSTNVEGKPKYARLILRRRD